MQTLIMTAGTIFAMCIPVLLGSWIARKRSPIAILLASTPIILLSILGIAAPQETTLIERYLDQFSELVRMSVEFPAISILIHLIWWATICVSYSSEKQEETPC